MHNMLWQADENEVGVHEWMMGFTNILWNNAIKSYTME